MTLLSSGSQNTQQATAAEQAQSPARLGSVFRRFLAREPLGLVRHLTTEIVEPHNTFEIVQAPGRILQFFEYRHDWREIWMDGRSLPALVDIEPKWNGYSVGRFDGNLLGGELRVVDAIAAVEDDGVNARARLHSEGVGIAHLLRWGRARCGIAARA